MAIVLAATAWYVRDSLKIDKVCQKCVFITGCDSGFGNLVARQLDQQGFRVIAGCLTEAGASSLQASASSGLKTVLLDVTKNESIARAVELVHQEVGERGDGGWG